MKTRNGFVSNSSSSSFIIAVKTALNKCDCCGRSDPNIIKLIEQYRNNYDSDETRIDAMGFERVMEHEYDHRWAYRVNDDPKLVKSERASLEKALKPYTNEKEWEIAAISISYHDGITNSVFENSVKSGSIMVIEKGD